VTFEPRLNFREHFDKFFLRKSNPDFYMNHHRTDTYQAGGVVTYSWDELTLPVAADYGEEIITSSNLGDHRRGHWDLVADPTYRWADDSSLNLTLRLDDYTTFGEEVTGSVSYKRVLDEAQDVYATFGRTMRVPTFTELYYSDPTTVGDPDLKPEHALNFETGWGRRFSEKVRTSLSFFVRQEDDTIDYTKLTPADPRFVARNISQSIAFGPSLFGEWRASERIAWDMRYSYTEKRSDDGGLIYKYGPNYLKHFIDLGMTNVFSWGSHRVDIIMNKEPLRRAWTLVNERVSWDLSKGWEVFGEVENLLNVEYQETEGIPSSGRLFRVGVKATW
jgi:vitamin B12 transporter